MRQSAMLLPNLVMQEYGRHSTTERNSVPNDDLASLKVLKIQSKPLGDKVTK